MRVNSQVLFGNEIQSLRLRIKRCEKRINEEYETIANTRAEISEMEELMEKLTPDKVIAPLKKPEYERVYAILSKLVKNVGEVSSLRQLFTIGSSIFIYDTYYLLDEAKDRLNIGVDLINETTEILMGIDCYAKLEQCDQLALVKDFFRDDVRRFIEHEITDRLRFDEQIACYSVNGFLMGPDDDEEEYDDYFYAYCICNDSPFWLVYDALLDDKETLEEGCNLFKKVKMEMALEGKPVKFEEE